MLSQALAKPWVTSGARGEMGSSPPPSVSHRSEQSLPLHPSLGQGGHGGARDLTPALNTDPPNSKVTIQVRLEETDQRTDPASLHPMDLGNQDRKRKGSLTGLTGLNKHQAPGFLPSKTGLNPHQAEAGLCWFYWESWAGRAQHAEAHKGLSDSPPHTFFFSGSSLYFLDRILVRSRLLISG